MITIFINRLEFSYALLVRFVCMILDISRNEMARIDLCVYLNYTYTRGSLASLGPTRCCMGALIYYVDMAGGGGLAKCPYYYISLIE